MIVMRGTTRLTPLNEEVRDLVAEAKRHAREIFQNDGPSATETILAVWLWHAVRGSSPGFLRLDPDRKRKPKVRPAPIGVEADVRKA
jgi:hypothetical protein